ncbi:hypothetical protein JHK84_053118 [Glycine max]|nr:hypothetical protein JHK84_053118 [Glycine max]
MDKTEAKTFTYKVIPFPSKQECDKQQYQGFRLSKAIFVHNFPQLRRNCKISVAVSPQSFTMQPQIIQKPRH